MTDLDFLPYILSFLVSLLVTRVMMFVDIHDIPGDRSSHKLVTPRGGGLGILFAFYISWFLHGVSGFPFYEAYFNWLACVVVAALMGGVGFVDDLAGIRDAIKLGFQTLVCGILVFSGIKFMTVPLPFLGYVPLGFLGSLVTMFWLVGFMNAFNFMDGLNGMSSGVTIVASFFWFLITLKAGSEALSFSALIILAANLGFIGFNFPHAKIFMGDTGSLFLGALFSLWAVLSTLPEFGEISLWTMPMIFFIYLYDVIFTRIRRLLKGHSLLSAHREHLYQLLNRLGWSHARVTLVYMVFFFFQGSMAYGMQFVSPEYHSWFFMVLLPLYIALSLLIVKKARAQGIDL